jgi:hypothetical protein
MLEILHRVEENIESLINDHAAWRTKRVDYTPPVVDRVYRDLDLDGVNYRIYLHRIHPCDEAFYHPHPWPSAVRVIGAKSSSYEMAVGFGPSDGPPPPHAARLIVKHGMQYEMTHTDGWHYVRVTGEPSISLMVSGPVWDNSAPRTDKMNFRHLTATEEIEICDAVLAYYRH